MGQKIASLEIELLMATGQAVSDLVRFGGSVDKISAESIRNLDRIDAAMKGLSGMDGPTAQMVKFAGETARSAISATREANRIEKAGEAMVRQLERQNAAFGKSREELRSLRAEEHALAADRVGNSDLARRLREQEAALYDQEFAAARLRRLHPRRRRQTPTWQPRCGRSARNWRGCGPRTTLGTQPMRAPATARGASWRASRAWAVARRSAW